MTRQSTFLLGFLALTGFTLCSQVPSEGTSSSILDWYYAGRRSKVQLVDSLRFWAGTGYSRLNAATYNFAYIENDELEYTLISTLDTVNAGCFNIGGELMFRETAGIRVFINQQVTRSEALGFHMNLRRAGIGLEVGSGSYRLRISRENVVESFGWYVNRNTFLVHNYGFGDTSVVTRWGEGDREWKAIKLALVKSHDRGMTMWSAGLNREIGGYSLATGKTYDNGWGWLASGHWTHQAFGTNLVPDGFNCDDDACIRSMFWSFKITHTFGTKAKAALRSLKPNGRGPVNDGPATEPIYNIMSLGG